MKLIDLDVPALIITPEMQPDIRPLFGEPTRYRLFQGFKAKRFGEIIDFEEGFEYDGMSIPNAVRTVANLSPDGCHRLGDLFHDRGYSCLGKMTPRGRVWTRAELDAELKRLCAGAGMNHDKAATVEFFVNKFGWIAWREHERRIATGGLGAKSVVLRSPSINLHEATMPELFAYHQLNHARFTTP